MKLVKTIRFFDALVLGGLLWGVIFTSFFAVCVVLNIAFPDNLLVKFFHNFFTSLDNSIGYMESFFVDLNVTYFWAEKIVAIIFVPIFLFLAVIISLFFSKYKEILINTDGRLILNKRFNNIPVVILIKDIYQIEVNKTFQILGKPDMRGKLFEEVKYVGTIYPIKLKTPLNSYRFFIKGECLAELKKELMGIEFVEKDLNKNIIGVLFFISVVIILVSFLKIYFEKLM